MAYQLISMLLCLLGAGTAAVTLLLGIYTGVKRRKPLPFFYGAVALLYGGAMIRDLILSASPLACTRLSSAELTICILLLVLHLFFIWDILRLVRTGKRPE